MFRKIFCFSFTLLTIQLAYVLQLSAKTLPGGEIKFNNDTEVILEEEISIVPRQEEEERPFENVPRVVTSVTKIVKGIVTGNVHDIFHGAFSFAPREVSNRIISVYNQVVGFPGTTTTTTTTTTAAPTTAQSPQLTAVNSSAIVKPSDIVTEATGNATRILTKSYGNNSTEVIHELSETSEFNPEEDEEIDEEDEEEYEEEDSKKKRTLPKITSAAPEKVKPSA